MTIITVASLEGRFTLTERRNLAGTLTDAAKWTWKPRRAAGRLADFGNENGVFTADRVAAIRQAVR